MKKLFITLVCVAGLLLTMPVTLGQEGDRVYLYGGSAVLKSPNGKLTAAKETNP